MLFKELIAVYTDTHTEPININEELPILKMAGKDSYYSALKG
jgi:hypothetical protein